MSFDRIAPYYRMLELILAGGKLQRCRTSWLPEVNEAREILLVGEGHGRFLKVCAVRFPQACITCVDASAVMLRVAERRWREAGGNPDRVVFVHAELPAWRPPAARYDLLATHFFLDCFPPETLARVLAALAPAAAPGARWLVADFAVPDRGWRRWRAQIILALAYGFFRRVTQLQAGRLASPDGSLSQAGFQLVGRRVFELGLLHSDLWVRPADE